MTSKVKPTKQTWRITFVGTDDGIPVAIRVRRLLKYAKRTCNLECVTYDAGHDDIGKPIPVDPEIDAGKVDPGF